MCSIIFYGLCLPQTESLSFHCKSAWGVVSHLVQDTPLPLNSHHHCEAGGQFPTFILWWVMLALSGEMDWQSDCFITINPQQSDLFYYAIWSGLPSATMDCAARVPEKTGSLLLKEKQWEDLSSAATECQFSVCIEQQQSTTWTGRFHFASHHWQAFPLGVDSVHKNYLKPIRWSSAEKTLYKCMYGAGPQVLLVQWCIGREHLHNEFTSLGSSVNPDSVSD